MDKEITTEREYNRLKKLFENVDESKKQLVDELLKKAAFLKVELDLLEKSVNKEGAIQYSTKGNTRVSYHYKTYLQSLVVYQGIIKTLNGILNKDVVDSDDEFDEFIRSANDQLSS